PEGSARAATIHRTQETTMLTRIRAYPILWLGLLGATLCPAAVCWSQQSNAPGLDSKEVGYQSDAQDLYQKLASDQLQRIYLTEAFDQEMGSGTGASLAPADEPLRAQLGLPDGHGLVVVSVAPEGPAAKVGLKTSDILL